MEDLGPRDGAPLDDPPEAQLAGSLQKASWIAVVLACGVAVVLLAIGGYTGYSIVVGAVGLAAAVNLLP
jgi:hypothetical protein